MTRPSSESRAVRLADWISRPIHHVLIAAYPILFLLANNIGEVDPAESVVPIGIAVAGALGLFVVLIAVTVPSRRAALLVSIVAVLFLMYGHVANALRPLDIPGLALLGGWLTGGALLGMWAIAARGDLRGVTTLLNAAAVGLVAIATTTIVGHALADPGTYLGGQRVGSGVRSPTASPDASLPPGAAPLRDIYFLVVEDYGAPRPLNEYLNITDDGFFDWLDSGGFTVLRDTRSNYGRTPHSLASQMNMTYLDEVAEAMGPNSDRYGPLVEMIRDPEVAAFLQARGYVFAQVGSQWYLTATSDVADVNPQFAETSDFWAALSESTILPPIDDLLGFEDQLSPRRRVYQAAQWTLGTFPAVAELAGPKFVFWHFYLPHHPFVVDAAGNYVPDDEDETRPELDRRRTQWAYVDREMTKLISSLLDGPEETRPIIIVTTDEGPTPHHMPHSNGEIDWTRASDAELDQKFGIFAAYYLPGVNSACLYPTMSSVNTFRLIFDLYFDANLGLLPDRTYAHQDNKHLYALTDITDRLPQSSAGSPTPTRCQD